MIFSPFKCRQSNTNRQTWASWNLAFWKEKKPKYSL